MNHQSFTGTLHYLEYWSLNLLHMWCIHWSDGYSGQLIQEWLRLLATLAKFRPSGGWKMTKVVVSEHYLEYWSLDLLHTCMWCINWLGEFLAATKQLYKWYFPSVCLSLCLSHLFDYVPIILSSWNFQELLPMTKVRSIQKVKVTTQLSRFRTVTPVWIHIWWWNDAYSLMLLRRGALLFFKVIRQISRSHGSKNRRIWPKLAVSGLLTQVVWIHQ